MDGLDHVVKEGKARYIGISNCYAWQLAKANALAEKEGFAKFISVQGHYDLIFRDLALSDEEAVYLEELYVSHRLAGVMAQNSKAAAKQEHVWSTGDQKI